MLKKSFLLSPLQESVSNDSDPQAYDPVAISTMNDDAKRRLIPTFYWLNCINKTRDITHYRRNKVLSPWSLSIDDPRVESLFSGQSYSLSIFPPTVLSPTNSWFGVLYVSFPLPLLTLGLYSLPAFRPFTFLVYCTSSLVYTRCFFRESSFFSGLSVLHRPESCFVCFSIVLTKCRHAVFTRHCHGAANCCLLRHKVRYWYCVVSLVTDVLNHTFSMYCIFVSG